MTEAKLRKTIRRSRQHSAFADVVRRFVRNKPAVLGLAILVVVLFAILFAELIVPASAVTAYDTSARLCPPGNGHIFGTDHLGRDVFARIVYGTRITVGIGVGATLASLLLGAVVAAVCAINRRADFVIMRVIDVWNCVPAVLLALVFLAVLGSSVFNLILTLTVVSIPGFVVRIRSVLIAVNEQDYVKAARLSGTRTPMLVLRHILPNAVNTIIVDATMTVSSMMLSAAGLSVIGVGVSPPSPEWGAMLNYAMGHYNDAAYLIVFPALAIVLTALAVNLFGDGLRDALDPQSIK